MHYKDGTEAHIGDVVRGKTYNLPDEVIGVLVDITPGTETCNCKVSTGGVATQLGYIASGPLGGGYTLIFSKFDYSQCDFLEKVK